MGGHMMCSCKCRDSGLFLLQTGLLLLALKLHPSFHGLHVGVGGHQGRVLPPVAGLQQLVHPGVGPGLVNGHRALHRSLQEQKLVEGAAVAQPHAGGRHASPTLTSCRCIMCHVMSYLVNSSQFQHACIKQTHNSMFHRRVPVRVSVKAALRSIKEPSHDHEFRSGAGSGSQPALSSSSSQGCEHTHRRDHEDPAHGSHDVHDAHDAHDALDAHDAHDARGAVIGASRVASSSIIIGEAPARAPLDQVSFGACVQLAAVLDCVKRALSDLGPGLGCDAEGVRALAAGMAWDPFAERVAAVAGALHILQTLGPSVCPVTYFVQRFQEFVAAERVVQLPCGQLLSLRTRKLLGSRAECLVHHVATAEDVTPMLACYLHVRREDVGSIVSAVRIQVGTVTLTRIAPTLADAYDDQPYNISRMVVPPPATATATAAATVSLPPLCVPDSLLPCVRRFCLLPEDGCKPPLIIVASGAGCHVFDFVFESFVDLGAVVGGACLFTLPTEGSDLSQDNLRSIEACIQTGVPVMVRTRAGTPPSLATHPRLRLHVVYVRSLPLAQALHNVGAPALTRTTWHTTYARPLWEAVVAGACLSPHPLQTLAWRPAAHPDLPEDVALLSEMLHTGEEGVTLAQGATAHMWDILKAYSKYRHRRGYFRDTANPGGLTLDILAAAANAVGDLWADAVCADPTRPGLVRGVSCGPPPSSAASTVRADLLDTSMHD